MARQDLINRINAQWEATGPPWAARHQDKILNELYKHLEYDENIWAWLDGDWGYVLTRGGPGPHKHESSGAAVATDNRVIFIDIGWSARLLGLSVDELRYRNIQTIKPSTRGILFVHPGVVFVRTRDEDYWLYWGSNKVTEDEYEEAAASFIARVRPGLRARMPQGEVIDRMARGFSLVNRPDEGAQKLLLEALEDGEELESLKRVDYAINAPDAEEFEGHVAVTDRRVIMFNKGELPGDDDVSRLRFSDVSSVDRDEENRPSDVMIRSNTSPGYKLSFIAWDNPQRLVDSLRARVESDETRGEAARSVPESNSSPGNEVNIGSGQTAIPGSDIHDSEILADALASRVTEDNSLPSQDDTAALAAKRQKINRQWDRIAPEWWDGPDFRDLRQVLPNILEDDENIACVVGGECGSPVKKCVVLATDRRVLYLPRDDSKVVMHEILLSHVTSVSRKRGLWKSRVQIGRIDGSMAGIKLSHMEAKMILS